jgi:hypothetical protein
MVIVLMCDLITERSKLQGHLVDELSTLPIVDCVCGLFARVHPNSCGIQGKAYVNA